MSLVSSPESFDCPSEGSGGGGGGAALAASPLSFPFFFEEPRVLLFFCAALLGAASFSLSFSLSYLSFSLSSCFFC